MLPNSCQSMKLVLHWRVCANGTASQSHQSSLNNVTNYCRACCGAPIPEQILIQLSNNQSKKCQQCTDIQQPISHKKRKYCLFKAMHTHTGVLFILVKQTPLQFKWDLLKVTQCTNKNSKRHFGGNIIAAPIMFNNNIFLQSRKCYVLVLHRNRQGQSELWILILEVLLKHFSKGQEKIAVLIKY